MELFKLIAVLALGFFGLVFVYMIIRVATAAYFRSKSDYLKRTGHDGKTHEGR